MNNKRKMKKIKKNKKKKTFVNATMYPHPRKQLKKSKKRCYHICVKSSHVCPLVKLRKERKDCIFFYIYTYTSHFWYLHSFLCIWTKIWLNFPLIFGP
jgi:hypothetical protein